MTKSPNKVKVCHSNTVKGNKEGGGASHCYEVVVSLVALKGLYVKFENL